MHLSKSSKPFFLLQMIVEPENRVPDFIKAGADIVSVHCENASTIHLHRTINQVIEEVKFSWILWKWIPLVHFLMRLEVNIMLRWFSVCLLPLTSRDLIFHFYWFRSWSCLYRSKAWEQRLEWCSTLELLYLKLNTFSIVSLSLKGYIFPHFSWLTSTLFARPFFLFPAQFWAMA